MKILHIIPSLHGGGAEKFVIDLANELSKTDEVVICSLFQLKKNMFMADSIDKNIKIIILNKKLGLDFKIFIDLYRVIKQERPDVVNTHLRSLFYSALAIAIRSTDFFHTVHSLAEKETSKKIRIVYKLFFKYLGVTPIAITKIVLDSINREYNINSNIVIENGVKEIDVSNECFLVKQEIDSLKTSDNTKVLLTIARISDEKNQVLLVNTVNRLVSEGFDIVLLIIGSESNKKQQLLNKLKAISCNRIYFLGMKKNVIDYLNCADAFCLSSLYEGLPITLLEALSVGKVSICTPAGGIVDVVNNEIGFISKNFSEIEYYNTLKTFLNTSPEELNMMQKNAKKVFKKEYDIRITAKRYRQLYIMKKQ